MNRMTLNLKEVPKDELQTGYAYLVVREDKHSTDYDVLFLWDGVDLAIAEDYSGLFFKLGEIGITEDE